MIPKRIINTSWDQDSPLTSLLNVSSRGVFGTLQKTASGGSSCPLYKDIKPEKGYSFIHIITTGSGEYYGPNTNADYFNEGPRSFTFTDPAPGIQKTASLSGGLKNYHHTYMQFGGVYRMHRNSKKGFAKEGSVVAEWYNPAMHRGEVIVKLQDDKWGDTLQKIANGEQIAWSMGAGLPEDICSNCGNRASTREQYCICLKYKKLQLDKEGRQIFSINDKPHFHDISEVINPADKIALTLQKVANARGSIRSIGEFVQDSTDGLYLPRSLMYKLASRRELDRLTLIEKLAEIEKEIKTNACEEISALQEALTLSDDEENEVVDEVKDMDPDKLIESLNKKDMMLTPNTFTRILIGKWPSEIDGVVNFEGALKSVFGDILEDGNLKDVLEDSSFTPSGSFPGMSCLNRMEGLSELLSLNPEPVQKRVIKITISPGPARKLDKEGSSAEPSEEARVLAREYAKYQLGFLSGKGDRISPFLVLCRK